MGLKVGTVRLEDYNPEWKNSFELEKIVLSNIFKDIALSIEHVGSTSIEGLSAKPIIDMLVIIKTFSNFENVRYYFEKEPYSIKLDSPEDEILIRKGDEINRTHFIHVVELGSDRQINTLLFRDYLRENKDAVLEYENLKKELAIKYADDRKMYTASKNDFIQGILKKAKEIK